MIEHRTSSETLARIGKKTERQLDAWIEMATKASMAKYPSTGYEVKWIAIGHYSLEESTFPFSAYWSNALLQMIMTDAGVNAALIERLFSEEYA
jgi:hypothetical protein